MSLQDLTSIAGIPGLDVAVTLAIDLYTAVQNVKIYKGQCKELSHRCTVLLLALRDSSSGMEGTDLIKAVDEVEAIVSRAQRKAVSWASLSKVRSIISQGDIKQGLDQLYRDLDLAMTRFNINTNVDIGRGVRDLALIQARDHAEDRETLQTIVKNVEDLKTIVGMQTPAVEHFMQTIQEELQEPGANSEQQQRDLQQGLWELHRRTTLIPPMTDLTGQVIKTSEYPVAFGAYNDVYTGEWLGAEKVALKLARAVNHTPKAQKRFHAEVDIWRTLQHPYISRLYGLVYFGDHLYSVSPWMEHRDATAYISNNPAVNRLKLLAEVASGMEYLHLHKVVHGDLRGANILISEAGVACISDFGLSKIIEEVCPDMSSTNTGVGPVRWQAPELVNPEDHGLQTVAVTTATDVWSYGMLCLEIMSGERPFSNRPRDVNVIQDLMSGKLPDRPGAHCLSRGLSDQLWDLMCACWKSKPSTRPAMTFIRPKMKALQSKRDNIVTESDRFTESPMQILAEIPPVVESPRQSDISSGFNLSLTPSHMRSGHRPVTSPGSAQVDLSPIAESSRPSDVGSIVYPSSSKKFTGHRPATSPGRDQEVPSPTLGVTRGRTGSSSSASQMSESPTNDIAISLPVSRVSHRPSVSSYRSLPSLPSPHIHVTPPDRGALGLTVQDPPMELAISPSHTNQSAGRAIIPSPPTVHELSLHSSKLNPVFSSGLSLAMQRHGTNGYNPETGLSLATRIDAYDRNVQASPWTLPSTLPTSFGPPLRHQRSQSLFDGVPSDIASITSSEGALLRNTDASLVDDASIVHLAADGTVLAGTLGGLVHRLLTDSSDFAKDQLFREVFFITYRAFSTAEEVFKLLLRRFRATDSDPTIGAENRVTQRHLVIVVLKHWYKQPHASAIDMALLEDMKYFTESIRTPPTMKAAAQELSGVIDRLIHSPSRASAISPLLTSLNERVIPRASDITPKDLAIALTILESDRYNGITADDCISHLLQMRGRNNVATARATNNKIVNWVKKSILRSNQLEKRGETLKFFINAADECRRLNNFSSMSALVAGVESMTVARLRLTRDLLDKSAHETLKKLAILLDPSHNHRTYREALLNGASGSCLPWFAVHLKDMYAVFRGRPAVVEMDSRSLINFDRYIRVSERIKHILHYQEKGHDFEKSREAGPLAYLEAELRKIGADASTDDALEARSLELQLQEDRAFDHRVLELQAAGFRAGVRH